MNTPKQLQNLYIKLWMSKQLNSPTYNEFRQYVEDNVYKGNTTKDRIYAKYGIPLETKQDKAEKLLLKFGSFDKIRKEIEIEHSKTSNIILAKYKEHKKELNKILTKV